MNLVLILIEMLYFIIDVVYCLFRWRPSHRNVYSVNFVFVVVVVVAVVSCIYSTDINKVIITVVTVRKKKRRRRKPLDRSIGLRWFSFGKQPINELKDHWSIPSVSVTQRDKSRRILITFHRFHSCLVIYSVSHRLDEQRDELLSWTSHLTCCYSTDRFVMRRRTKKHTSSSLMFFVLLSVYWYIDKREREEILVNCYSILFIKHIFCWPIKSEEFR